MSDPSEVVATLDGILYDGASIDQVSQMAILQAVKRLLARVQSPTDKVMELCWDHPAVYASMKTLFDLGIWNAWTKMNGGTRSLDQIRDMASPDVDPKLLARLLRSLASNHILQEAGSDRYTPTPFSLALGDDDSFVHNLIPWSTDHVLPACHNLPSFLKTSSYRDPVDAKSSSYADAFPENLPMFDRCGSGTPHQATFDRMHRAWIQSKVPWPQVYDTEMLVSEADLSRPVVVDIGGHTGVDLMNVLQAHPDLPSGALVLQDRPEVIAKVAVDERIKVMEYDFFEPQPTTGARAYYLGMILHDWPDKAASQILAHVKTAMRKGYSKLLISDIVVSDTGATSSETSFDIQMMALLSGVERTESEWTHLLSESGFEIVKIWKHPRRLDVIIEAEVV